MIERQFQIPFVARLALAEKQIQQNYRPLIAVHKWFARRPGTLFRSLLLSEFCDSPLAESYFARHNFPDRHVFDPFMGGGTTVMEANRLGCAVTASDINPMAWWIVRQEILDLDLDAYRSAAEALRSHLEDSMGDLFLTTCPKTGQQVSAKYFLWVKTSVCPSCGHSHDLFPNHLIARDVRHTANVFACGHCGSVYETKERTHPDPCPCCGKPVASEHVAGRNRSKCLRCGEAISYPGSEPLAHRLFAIEYHNPDAHQAGAPKGRLFKSPDTDDLSRFAEAAERLMRLRPRFIPEDRIPLGDETERLHRWGYRHYRELFNARQLFGLELSCRWISGHPNESIREALATNLSDLLRYQNLLCRYDAMALKSLDIFSVHGFPVGLVACESNFLGIRGPRGLPVGSGGWLNITEKFGKAKAYCSRPFEIRQEGKRKVEVPIQGEWIGTFRNGAHPPEHRTVNLICGDSASLPPDEKFDAIFTDPPYFGNVQYAELMDFCYVWLRKLVGHEHPAFAPSSTRNAAELTGNINMGRDLAHFTEGISGAFVRSASALKPGGPLAFTYHHNKLDAYIPLVVAILDSRLVCSASLPCPAEMGASIHINGTGSSVIDTVFVCRHTGRIPKRWIVDSATGVASLVNDEVDQLRAGGLKATQGDIRCIAYGHLVRLAVWNLRINWNPEESTAERMRRVGDWFEQFGGWKAVSNALEACYSSAPAKQEWMLESLLREEPLNVDEISF